MLVPLGHCNTSAMNVSVLHLVFEPAVFIRGARTCICTPKTLALAFAEVIFIKPLVITLPLFTILFVLIRAIRDEARSAAARSQAAEKQADGLAPSGASSAGLCIILGEGGPGRWGSGGEPGPALWGRATARYHFRRPPWAISQFTGRSVTERRW
jgi:hypothetical protein